MVPPAQPDGDKPDVVPVNEDLLKHPPRGVRCPSYDRSRVREGILHLAVGGFHRAHEALYMEEMIEKHGGYQWGICGVGIMDGDRMLNEALSAQQSLYTLVERSGSADRARIVGAIRRHLLGPKNPEAVFAKMADPDIRIVSITATEGGYCLNQATGDFDDQHPAVINDLTQPAQPQTIFGYLAEGLDRRRKAGTAPVTVLSCDNLQGNGDIAKRMLLAFCERRNPGLAKWIGQNITFPNSMVDRITPRTTQAELDFVRNDFGLADNCPVVCESFRQWFIEDEFCNERPLLENVGVQITSDVRPYERMKLRLLNAGHSALGYLGYLAGFRLIHDAALDKDFSAYLRRMMDREVTPLLGDIPGVNLDEYKDSLLKRFSNQTIQDQVKRICCDGSDKMPKFVIPSIREQLEKGGPIKLLTLCVASWLRFLNGVDEQGKEIEIEDQVAGRLRTVAAVAGQKPDAFLDMDDIFSDLKSANRFVGQLTDMLTSLYRCGSRRTLQRCLDT